MPGHFDNPCDALEIRQTRIEMAQATLGTMDASDDVFASLEQAMVTGLDPETGEELTDA